MEQFLKMNPGLKSRFDRELYFQDFSDKELCDIAAIMLRNEGLEPSKEAVDELDIYVKNMVRNKDRYFGNARTVRKVIDQAVKQQNLRVASLPPEERTLEILSGLAVEDIQNIRLDETETSTGAVGFRV
jgi:hypothetical protein